jgi:hypothetical protein
VAELHGHTQYVHAVAWSQEAGEVLSPRANR